MARRKKNDSRSSNQHDIPSQTAESNGACDLPVVVYRLMLLIVIAVSIWLQRPGLNSEMLERVHGWRQAQTAMTSRNFIRDGMNPFVAHVDYMGDAPMQLEFPLYQYLTAACYGIFGIDEVWGRYIACLFGIGSTAVVYLLGAHVRSERAGLIAAAIFAWSPLNLFFNRAIMPDSGTIFFTLLALWAFLRYFQSHSTRSLVTACVTIALALAGKPPIVVSVLPPLALALLLAHPRDFWKQGRLAIGLICAAVTFGGWMQYSSHINNAPENKAAGLLIPGSFTNAGEFNDKLMDWYFGTAQQRADSRTYDRIWGRVSDWTGHWAPGAAQSLVESDKSKHETTVEAVGRYFVLWLAAIGLLVCSTSKRGWVVIAWAIGSVAYVLVFLNVNFIHNYYQMPLIPLIAVAVGVGVDAVVCVAVRLIESTGVRRSMAMPAVSALTCVVLLAGQVRASSAVMQSYDPLRQTWMSTARPENAPSPYWMVRTDVVNLGREIHEALPDNGGLLALAGDYSRVADVRDPQLLYYIDRRGFIIAVADDAKAELEDQVRQRKIPGNQLRSRIYQWIDAHFIEFVDKAIAEKDVRTLVVMNPGVLLSQQTRQTLLNRFHQHDASNGYWIFDLTRKP